MSEPQNQIAIEIMRSLTAKILFHAAISGHSTFLPPDEELIKVVQDIIGDQMFPKSKCHGCWDSGVLWNNSDTVNPCSCVRGEKIRGLLALESVNEICRLIYEDTQSLRYKGVFVKSL